jgi:O-antigen/teichoic acid export membrane protein
MNLLKKNIAANFAGSLWTSLMSLLCVPLYIHFMGIEAYGLVGIFATLLAFMPLMDLGLTNTLNREMARLSAQGNKAKEMRDLLRTLELPYWGLAVLIGVSIVQLSPFIAYRWVYVVALTPATVQRAITIMGIAIGLQWPLSFYSGGLMGLQRQVLLSSINAIIATCRGLGAILILWFISPTIETFFLWQCAVNATHTGLITFFLWSSLSSTREKPCFRFDLLTNMWQFAAGVTGITMLATIYTQLDKVILSRMLSLEMFGYYSLANAMASYLYRAVDPVNIAIFPRLTYLTTLESKEELARLYHKSTQLVSVLILPAAAVLAFFSWEILLLWTQNPKTAQSTHLLVSILVLGTALSGLMNTPFTLQLASGWTKLGFAVNLVSVLVLVPLMIVLTNWYGALGAASVWVTLNSGQVLISIPIMHRRLLPTEKWQWYCSDIGLPFAVSFTVASAFRLMLPTSVNMLWLLAYLILVACVTVSATALSTSVTRNWIRTKISTLRVSYASTS